MQDRRNHPDAISDVSGDSAVVPAVERKLQESALKQILVVIDYFPASPVLER